ncbi:hypothetical protein VTI28DRAFT_5927 [Corynascus sepedonium]
MILLAEPTDKRRESRSRPRLARRSSPGEALGQNFRGAPVPPPNVMERSVRLAGQAKRAGTVSRPIWRLPSGAAKTPTARLYLPLQQRKAREEIPALESAVRGKAV